MLNQIRSHLRFSVISMEHICFASHPFNFNKHVFLLYSHVCKTKELLCHALFTYLKPLSRCDTYIPRRCHTKILNNRCLNTRLIRNGTIFAEKAQMTLVKYESWRANGNIQPCTVIGQIANQVVFHFRGCFISRIILAKAIS